MPLTRTALKKRPPTVIDHESDDDREMTDFKAMMRKKKVSEKSLTRSRGALKALMQLQAMDKQRRATQTGNDEKKIVPAATKSNHKAEKGVKQKVQKKTHDKPQKQNAPLNGLI